MYSSEWFWSKILHVLRADAKVRGAAFSWVEHCDWMPALLTGTTDPLTMKRSRCAAGHKAMWHTDWDGLPPEEFLVKVDPLLRGLRARLFKDTYTSDQGAGGLTAEWAKRLGLKPGTAVAVGAFDAHMGAVGGGITDRATGEDHGHLDVRRARGPPQGRGRQVRRRASAARWTARSSPAWSGLEAGQSAFGDVYAWFKDLLAWPLRGSGERREEGKGIGPRRRARGDRGHDPRQAVRGSREGRPGRVHRGGAGLAERAAHAVCRPDPEGRDRRPDAGDHGTEDLPRAGGGHGIRVPRHRRAVPQGRGARSAR